MPVDAERSIVISESCGPLRRRMGPVAWSVLEELLLVGDLAEDVLVATVSVRVLAQRLGLSKDTVNRATLRLRGEGLVAFEGAARSDDSGRFAGSSYRVDLSLVPIRRLDNLASHRATDLTTHTRHAPGSRSRHPLACATVAQLSLLDTD